MLQFKSGQLDGGWEPEPYATEMVLDGGKRLVNEASLWPGGKFVTTQLIVMSSYLKDHPDVVNGLLKGQIEATSFINQNQSEAEQIMPCESPEEHNNSTGKTGNQNSLCHRNSLLCFYV